MTNRHASRRPGSHQNQLNSFTVTLPPVGGDAGWAKPTVGRALPRATAPDTAAALLSSPRRVMRSDDSLAIYTLSSLSRISRESLTRLATAQPIVNILTQLERGILSAESGLSTFPREPT